MGSSLHLSSSFGWLEKLVLAALLSLLPSLVSATWCNICDYTKADSCEEPAHFRRVDCSTFWSASRFCLKFNGTRHAVRKNGGEVSTSGVHRACELESDLETYGLMEAAPGCRNLHVLNKNTSLYSTFVYDGTLCICQEDDCNKAKINSPSSLIFTLLISAIIFYRSRRTTL